MYAEVLDLLITIIHNYEIVGVNLVVGINESNVDLNNLIDTGPQVTGLNVLADLLLDRDKDLLPDDWEGHPLRKDFGVGSVPVQFKDSHKVR